MESLFGPGHPLLPFLAHRGGVAEAGNGGRLAPDNAVQVRADAAAPSLVDRVTGAALIEDALTGFGILRQRRHRHCEGEAYKAGGQNNLSDHFVGFHFMH